MFLERVRTGKRRRRPIGQCRCNPRFFLTISFSSHQFITCFGLSLAAWIFTEFSPQQMVCQSGLIQAHSNATVCFIRLNRTPRSLRVLIMLLAHTKRADLSYLSQMQTSSLRGGYMLLRGTHNRGASPPQLSLEEVLATAADFPTLAWLALALKPPLESPTVQAPLNRYLDAFHRFISTARGSTCPCDGHGPNRGTAHTTCVWRDTGTRGTGGCHAPRSRAHRRS